MSCSEEDKFNLKQIFSWLFGGNGNYMADKSEKIVNSESYEQCGPFKDYSMISIENSKNLFYELYYNFKELARERYSGNPILLLLGIDEGYDKNKKYNIFENPPLAYCVNVDHYKKYFINSKNIIGETSFTWAIQSNNLEIIKFALKNCSIISSSDLTVLFSRQRILKGLDIVLEENKIRGYPSYLNLNPLNHIIEYRIYEFLKDDHNKSRFYFSSSFVNLISMRSLNLGRKAISLNFDLYNFTEPPYSIYYRDEGNLISNNNTILLKLFPDDDIIRGTYISDFDRFLIEFQDNLMELEEDMYVYRGLKMDTCKIDGINEDIFEYLNSTGVLKKRDR